MEIIPVLISSFSDPNTVALGKVLLYPINLTISAYTEAFRTNEIMIEVLAEILGLED